MLNKFIYVVTVLIVISLGLLNSSKVVEEPVTDICLTCMCETRTACNTTAICVNGACGLFRITWAYWVDGGKLTIPGESVLADSAWTNCVNDPYCAAKTIQGYMRKYGRDCNGDGDINCVDYALIHKLGFVGCTGNILFKHQNRFVECLERYIEEFGKGLVKSDFL